jgi:hypothetical protein
METLNLKANFQMADRKVVLYILLHPLLFLKIRKKIHEITFNPRHPVKFLLYSDKKSLERMTFELGKDVHVWRTWKNGRHFVGICYGLRLVREALIQSVLHEIGHVICHETGHESHRISSETLKKIQKALEEKTITYRQALKEIFTKFPLLSKFDAMCQIIDLGDILREFYANDVMIKYSDLENRLEELTAEAEDLCQGLCSFINKIPIVFTSPFATFRPVMISVVSEASAYRISKRATQLGNKLKQSQNRLDEIYECLPSEAAQLRKKLVPFLSNLNENPSSSEVVKYLSSLQEHISIFFDTYTWWLRDAEDELRNARTLKNLLKSLGEN